MNCFNCNLMFNIRRKKVTYECGYSFCEECLLSKVKTIPQSCPIEKHHQCRIAQAANSADYQKNIFDKKLKIVFVGNNTVGKTTLIQTLNNINQNKIASVKPKKTLSTDLISVVRSVKDLTLQYNLWDTTSQSSIFGQGYDLSFKNSDVQIIVYKDGDNLEKVKYLFEFVLQKSQRNYVIIVENLTKEGQQDTSEALMQILQGKKYKYLKMDCRDHQQVNNLWKLLDTDCLTLKQNISKLKGNIIQALQHDIPNQPPRKRCHC